MCSSYAQLAYCMPVDPYSLIVAVRRYHGVRGAFIAMDFIRDRKERTILQTSDETATVSIANLPIEVIEVVSAKLLEADSHKTRCDCWARYKESWQGECTCLEAVAQSCKSRKNHCECFDHFLADHCWHECPSREYIYDELDDAARAWCAKLQRLKKKDIRQSKKTTAYWAAVSLR